MNADRRFLSLNRSTGPQLPLEVQSGRHARHAQTWRDLADADFAYPREPMTLGWALTTIAIMATSASVVVGLMMWVIEELAK